MTKRNGTRPSKNGHRAVVDDVVLGSEKNGVVTKPAGPGKKLFQKGNPGKPKGAKWKMPTKQRLSAMEAFSPINDEALKLARQHLAFHVAAQNKALKVMQNPSAEDIVVLATLNAALINGDCATCRHILTLSTEYVFGKAIQPHSFEEIDDLLNALTERGVMPIEKIQFLRVRAQEIMKLGLAAG